MKKILGIVAMTLVGAASYAQTGPKIEFKAENNTIDYGTVVKGKDSGVRTFEFTNTGDEPLVITNVRSSCGCTVPSKPEAPILPGKSDKIEVKYNMNPGTISKTITVESNAKNIDGGTVALYIKGKVVEE
ncbi:DUF1573 domain-containing protein [Flavobacterium sp. xlx-214]|uniref:DUF1573 domain-containing protein n=1 Tax=unclassified Flavobacterium TaxID=196869 RepID=UPI0013D0291B|nr:MULTISPECIES: DUF1573 domain-containing protein [unclassified Flavobacterium]MBA5793138.1 DUF1573 domain-containing protein [Flavobacterium sp. xlx-221]QMI82577.1 DUF1573 domain-containing protein [Flavobacterium sp. xlx-214]